MVVDLLFSGTKMLKNCTLASGTMPYRIQVLPNPFKKLHFGIELPIDFFLFYLQDCPEVHTNAAETLCAITRYAPPGLASKISSPRFHTLFLY